MKQNRLFTLLPIFAIALFAALCILLHTAPDKLIGAAFCHQIASRSPGYQFPFCYRCSGLFSGIFFGLLYFLLTENGKDLFSRRSILLFTAAFLLFLADILNSKEFLGIDWYRESTEFRFLSAFPLGFFLSGLIVPALFYFTGHVGSKQRQFLSEFGCFICSWGLSYLLIFGNNRFLLETARVIVCAGSFAFLFICYLILVHCAATLKQREIRLRTAVFLAVFFAVMQISLFGFLHIRLIPFELILQ